MRYAVGIDIGGTKIASGIVNEKGDLIQKEVMKSDPSDKEGMFSQVIECVKRLLNHSSIPHDEIYGIGAGIPGKVDRENGIAIFQNNLPWSNFPFVKKIQETLGVERIVIDNDVYMAAFAEWEKANLLENELFAYVTISTGIACSFIQGGQFIRGTGFAGELGLIPVYTKHKEKHMERLEKIASGPAIEKQGKKMYEEKIMVAKDIFAAFYHGDPKAQQLINELTSSLAQGVYMINSLLDPHKIVFGGSVATNNPLLLDLIKEKLNFYLIEEQKHILEGMEISQLNNDQGIIGAGLRAFNL